MQQSTEWAYIGRSQGPHRVVQKHKTLNKAVWSERTRLQNYLISVFFQFVLNVKKITLIIFHCF